MNNDFPIKYSYEIFFKIHTSNYFQHLYYKKRFQFCFVSLFHENGFLTHNQIFSYNDKRLNVIQVSQYFHIKKTILNFVKFFFLIRKYTISYKYITCFSKLYQNCDVKSFDFFIAFLTWYEFWLLFNMNASRLHTLKFHWLCLKVLIIVEFYALKKLKNK